MHSELYCSRGLRKILDRELLNSEMLILLSVLRRADGSLRRSAIHLR